MIACLDACVLYPTILRELLLKAAARHLFEPLWSPRILEEWARAVAANHPDQAASVRVEIALAEAKFPEASVAVINENAADFDLPDPDDVHVLQAAIKARAECLVTLNLKDFPPRIAARFGIRVLHPDWFLLELLRENPKEIVAIANEVHKNSQAMAGLDFDLRKLMKKARLPRFAKAISTEIPV